MFTIFSIPKAFQGRFKIIQTNAIRSWTMLRPKPQIILLGDDQGTAEIAQDLGLEYLPHIKRNEYGTPLMNDIFQQGQTKAGNETVCYVNADIILLSDFTEAIKKVTQLLGEKAFLIVGRKSNIELNELLDFGKSDWELRLREDVKNRGEYVTYDSDFFVFPRGMFNEMPPFAIGRCYWTQWLIYDARRRGITVVDATKMIASIESKHDYSHAKSTGGAKRLSGVEYVSNRRLFKGCKYFTTLDATQILTPSGLARGPSSNRILSLEVRAEYYIYFLLKGNLYPYSLPLILLYRLGKKIFRTCQGLLPLSLKSKS